MRMPNQYERTRYKAQWQELAESMRRRGGWPWPTESQRASEFTPEERIARYEELWERGGIHMAINSYRSVLTDPELNEEVSEFVRGKIRAVVDDPETARKLMPDYYFGTKRLILDNGYDPEVLNRDDIQLSELPRVLHYLNARILQMHEVWHLVAGYRTTSSGEIAISAFQLAQFGHNYSALFLATVATTSAESRIEGLPILLTIISEAWAHGRRSPPLMTVNWEAHWGTSLQTLREDIGLQPFQSSLPANLFEMLAAAN